MLETGDFSFILINTRTMQIFVSQKEDQPLHNDHFYNHKLLDKWFPTGALKKC